MARQLSKLTLRKTIKNKLLKLNTQDKLKQSTIVADKLFSLPQFNNSKRVSIYLSTETEIDTEPILKKLFDLRKICFVPRYNGDVMEMVRLMSMDDWKRLPFTKWKIKQPEVTEKRENALETGGFDLMIVPGVAFTKEGKRLGHGKGYYDRYLNNLKNVQGRLPTTVALAFTEQIVEYVPTDEHDFLIDTVLHPQ